MSCAEAWKQSTMSEREHVYVTYIATSAERLWQALTDGEFTRQYWGGLRIRSEWQAGSPVEHVKDDGGIVLAGVVLEADRPRLLSYTFHMLISDGHRDDAPSRVRFELHPMGDVMRLTLTHDRFGPDSVTFETTRYGWPAIMSSLKSLLETGKPLPFAGLGFGPGGRAGTSG